MERYKEEFIEFMVEAQVLRFGEFITKSGRKSPFFINTGFYRSGKQLAKLGTYYAQAIHACFGTEFDVLFGPAYKGIPLAVCTAMQFDSLYGTEVRYCSNRKEVKDHGDTGILLGGPITDGDRVVLVEDVTTSGKSIDETMPILQAQGKINCLGLVVSVDRMERGKGEMSALKELAKTYGIRTAAIVTMQEVVDYLYGKPYNGTVLIDAAMKQSIDEYYAQYGAVKEI